MPQFARQLVHIGGTAPSGVSVYNYMAPAHGSIGQENVDDFYAQLTASMDASDGSHVAAGVTMELDTSVGIHDVATGELIGNYTTGEDPYTLTGAGDGSENRATQIGLKWLTNDFRYGRKIQGRTFFGPASSAAMQSDGTIAEDIVAGWPDVFSGIYDNLGSRLIVYSRPKLEPISGTVIRTGDYADVVSMAVSQMPFVLRGRR